MRRRPLRSAAAPAVAAVALLAAVAVLPPVDFLDRPVPADLELYRTFGERMAGGELPYRHFTVEYPPGAVPVFLAPTVAGDDYPSAFRLLMLAVAAACAVLIALLLAASGAGRARLYAGAASLAGSVLLLRQVAFDRYDLWPAALLLGALLALVLGARRTGFALLGGGAIAKVYPLAALPPALLFGRERLPGRRELRDDLVPLLLVGALVSLPFLVTGFTGLGFSALQHLRRPLQIESLGGSLLLVAHRLGLYEAEVVSTYGSQNLAGTLPALVSAGQTLLQLAALLLVAVLFARGPRGRPELLTAAAAGVAAFVAFNKVLSPQYMLWLAAIVPVVAARVWLPAVALAAGAFALTQAWFPARYAELVQLGGPVWLVLARNLLLVGLVALLLAGLRAHVRVTASR